MQPTPTPAVVLEYQRPSTSGAAWPWMLLIVGTLPCRRDLHRGDDRRSAEQSCGVQGVPLLDRCGRRTSHGRVGYSVVRRAPVHDRYLNDYRPEHPCSSGAAAVVDPF